MLEGEKDQVTAHLQRTESWCLHLGRWRCRVQSVEMTGDRESYYITLVTYVPFNISPGQLSPGHSPFNNTSLGQGMQVDSEDKAIGHAPPTSWMVGRSLAEFHELQKRLAPYFTWTRQLDLPSLGKPMFGRLSDKTAMDKSKVQIQVITRAGSLAVRTGSWTMFLTFCLHSQQLLF